MLHASKSQHEFARKWALGTIRSVASEFINEDDAVDTFLVGPCVFSDGVVYYKLNIPARYTLPGVGDVVEVFAPPSDG